MDRRVMVCTALLLVSVAQAALIICFFPSKLGKIKGYRRELVVTEAPISIVLNVLVRKSKSYRYCTERGEEQKTNTRGARAFLRTSIAYHQNLSHLLGSGLDAMAVLFENGLIPRAVSCAFVRGMA